MPTLSSANRDSLRRRGASSSSSSMKPRAPSSFWRRSSCAADEEEGRRARSPTTSTGGESVATCFKNEAKTWLGHSSAAPPTLLSVVTGVRSARRSHLQLDHRPLHITTFERFRRYAETTNIHGFLPLSRYKEIGWFFRVVYLFMLSCGISCAFYFIRLETINFWKDVVDITNDFEQATAKDLYFPQVALCNSNFIQGTFLEEFNISEHSNLIIQYYFSGSPKDITDKQKKIISKIEEMTLARRVAGALMRFGNSTSIKDLLAQVENKTDEQLLALASRTGMPTPLALVTGIKPGFRSVLRATFNSKERNPSFMAPFFPAYRTDFGWCSLVIPMVQFEERFQNENFQTLREKRSPKVNRGARLGQEGGLRLLVDAEVYDYSYGSEGAEGFQVGIVPHRDIPLMFLEETQVRPGSLTNIIVKPVITKTEPEVRSRFDAKTRQCYFQEEVVTDKAVGIGGNNRHRYSLSNCYWQATVSHGTEVCGCKMWNYGEATKELNFCVGENLTCFREIIKEFSKYRSFTDNNNNTFECYNDCEAYIHSISTNSGSYPNSETFLYDFADYCAIVDKMSMSCKDQFKREKLGKTTFNCSVLETKKNRQDVESCVQYVYSSKAGGGGGKDSGIQRNTKRFRENDELRQAVWNYTASNVAVVNVYFNEINVQRLVRKEAYTISAFMGAIGGLLSLAMGISFVTFFETSYMILRILLLVIFHCLAHCCKRRRSAERDSHADSNYD